MALVTSKPTAWPSATAPTVASTGPSIAGWLFQLVVVSLQPQLVILWIWPPDTLWAFVVVATFRLSSAWVTVRAPTLLTCTRRKLRLMPGPASTLSWVLVPRLVAGVSEATATSATMVAVGVAAGGGGAGQVQFAWHWPGQAALAVPSHCSPGWLSTLSPHTGAGGGGAGAHGQLMVSTRAGRFAAVVASREL